MPGELAGAPFEPTRGADRRAGAGLGLSIAKAIVDAHGGRIELMPPTGHALRDLPAGGARTARRRAEQRTGTAVDDGGARATGARDRARNTRALVVEDDPNIVDLIRSNLAVRGFDTVVSTDGVRALQLLETEEPDIVLLDLMLPEVDGFELCRQIRERSSVGIIVVSARGGERDKVTALNMGADDYMTKPFSIEELLARITATLRRTRPAALDRAGPPVVTAGDIEIDLASQQVTRRGEPVHLTPTEFALLRELATNRGKLLTHAHLLRRVWGPGYETETEYVRVYVRRLRAKLEADGEPPADPHPAPGRLPLRPRMTRTALAAFTVFLHGGRCSGRVYSAAPRVLSTSSMPRALTCARASPWSCSFVIQDEVVYVQPCPGRAPCIVAGRGRWPRPGGVR